MPQIVRVIQEAIVVGFSKGFSPGERGSERYHSKASMEDLSPPSSQRATGFRCEDESMQLVANMVESPKSGGDDSRGIVVSDLEFKIEDESHIDTESAKQGKEEEEMVMNQEMEAEYEILAEMEDGINLDTETEKEGVVEIQKETRKNDFDCRTHAKREELARSFEKMVLKAARETQAKEAIWILGSNVQQQFDPVYFLVMETGEFGSELELEQLGPPPCSRGEKDENIDDKQRDRASLVAAMADVQSLVKTTGKEEDEEKSDRAKHLETSGAIGSKMWRASDHLGSPHWPNSILYNSESLKRGNSWIGLFPIQKENGPEFLAIKCGPGIGITKTTHRRTSANTFRHLQPRDELDSILPVEQPRYLRSLFRMPPLAKPPPQVSVVLSSCFPNLIGSSHPTSLQLKGCVDAANHDLLVFEILPLNSHFTLGDILLHKILTCL